MTVTEYYYRHGVASSNHGTFQVFTAVNSAASGFKFNLVQCLMLVAKIIPVFVPK